MKVFCSSIINRISNTTLGIYLIHSNTFIGPIIWENIFKCTTFANSKFLIINAFLDIGLIFMMCSIIDIVRQFTLDILINKQVDKILNKIQILSKKYKR